MTNASMLVITSTMCAINKCIIHYDNYLQILALQNILQPHVPEQHDNLITNII